MRSHKDLLEDCIRAADPLADEEPNATPDEAERLLASIMATGRFDGAQASPSTRRERPAGTRNRRYLVAVPVVAAMVAILAAGLPGDDGGKPSTMPVLARVAQAAAALPPAQSDMPYVFTKTRSIATNTSVAGGHAWSVYAPTTREQWTAADGSGRVRVVAERPRWVSVADREAWEASDRIPFLAHGWARHVSVEEIRAGTPRALSARSRILPELPTDPTDLAAWLEHQVRDPKAGAGAGNGFSVAVRTLTLVAEILSDPLASPELRAGLYEAEGQIPGIEYLGKVTDQQGRHGVAVGAESSNSGAPTIYSLIFDPQTSRVLATQQEILEAPSALPDQDYPSKESVLYLESGPTTSIGAKPGG